MLQKNIFRLFSRLNVGGPSLHVVNLAVGLKEFGYTTQLIVGRPDPSEGSMSYYADQVGAEYAVIESFCAAISPWKDLKTLFKLILLFRRECPEIVHTHTFKAGLLGRIAAKLTGVPVIVHTYHGHLLSGYSTDWKIKILIRIETFLGKISHRLVTVSRQVADDLVLAGVAPRSKFKVIELGFDLANLKKVLQLPSRLRDELGIGQSSLVVGVVGRLVPVKAVDFFLRALAPLLRDMADLHLVIIGDGSERAALEILAAQLHPEKTRIHFTGWRNPAACDFKALNVCVCSSLNEGTSVSIIEAVIAGVPVVSTRVGGMSDLLENGRWGRMVNQDEAELRCAVRETLFDRNPTPNAHMASDFFSRRFSSTRLINEIDALYRDIQSEEHNAIARN